MRERTDATHNRSVIECIEVLISRSHLQNSSHNILWTLSVYSLENKPVKKGTSLRNSEIFHFMTYDWDRTIKNLLNDHKVTYAVIQHFSTPNICNGVVDGLLEIPENEAALLSAASRLCEHSGVAGSYVAAGLPEQEENGWLLAERFR